MKCKNCKHWGGKIPDLVWYEEVVKRQPDEELFREGLVYSKKINKRFRVCSNKKFRSDLDYPKRSKLGNETAYGEYGNMDSGYGSGSYFVSGENFGCIHFVKKEKK